MAKIRIASVLLRILKIFGIAFLVIFVLFSTVSWIVFKKKNDWLLEQIQSYVNESQSGELKIASVDLKLFRSFPHVSIALDSINYYQHRDSLRTPDEQPILRAKQLFIAIKLLPLMKDELIISEISLAKAEVNIIELQKGVLNIDLALAKPVRPTSTVLPKKVVPKPPVTTSPAPKKPKPKADPTVSSGVQVDLQSIHVDEVLLSWKSLKRRKPSIVLVKKAKADLSKEGNVLTAKLTSSSHITSLFLNGISFPSGDLVFSTDVRYELDRQQLTVRKSKLKYDIFSVSLQGTYSHQGNRMLDIQMDASSNDLELLSKVLKPEVVKQNPDLIKQGDIYVKGRIFGELKKQPPQIEISFGVSDLDLQLPGMANAFKNVGLKGKFNSGPLADYSQAIFDVSNLNAELPGGFVRGSFSMNNFVDPYLKYALDARLQLDGYDQIFNINSIKKIAGLVSLQANFDGPLNLLDNHQMDSSRSSSLTLNNLSFIFVKTNQPVSNLSGTIETRYNQTALKQLRVTYGNNDLAINATVENLAYLLFKRENAISASGHVHSNTLFTKDFIPDTLANAQVQDQINNLGFDFQIQTSADSIDESYIPNIDFEIRNLSAQLVKLPDIVKLDTKGQLRKTEDGLKLNVHEFYATMPHGKVEVVGALLIPEKKLLRFNARVKMTEFPWTYVMELVKEIQTGSEPKAKNIPVTEMEIVTADLDLSAELVTYPFDINKVEVRNSSIHFSIPASKPISVEELNVSLQHLHFKHPGNTGAITGLASAEGVLDLKGLTVPGLNKIDINLDVAGKDDQLDVKFSSASHNAKSEAGNLFLDISKKELEYRLHYSVQEANLTSFIEKYYKKKFMEGNINYVVDIRTAGSTWPMIKQNLAGTVEIRADSLTLYGADIDKVLRKYEKSQNFNLTDLGAVIIAGPLGLAVTKGTEFVSLATVNLNPAHQTKIRTLLARWKLEDRQLITDDVAFATYKNRIAFDGRIDFAHDTIPGFTIAVVDKAGCSLMDQKLYGKMGAIKTGKINITKTLFGSVINFVNAVVGKDCKIFYTGEVEAPLK